MTNRSTMERVGWSVFRAGENGQWQRCEFGGVYLFASRSDANDAIKSVV